MAAENECINKCIHACRVSMRWMVNIEIQTDVCCLCEGKLVIVSYSILQIFSTNLISKYEYKIPICQYLFW